MKNENKFRLTEKQEAFCRYYIDTQCSASEAYRMAYDTTKMQAGTIWLAAWELMHNPKAAQRIEAIKGERMQVTESERQQTEQRLLDIVTADVADLYYTDPKTGQARVRRPWQLSPKMRNAVKSVRGSGENLTYELHNKIEAAKMLAAMNGWNTVQQVNVGNSQDL